MLRHGLGLTEIDPLALCPPSSILHHHHAPPNSPFREARSIPSPGADSSIGRPAPQPDDTAPVAPVPAVPRGIRLPPLPPLLLARHLCVPHPGDSPCLPAHLCVSLSYAARSEGPRLTRQTRLPWPNGLLPFLRLAFSQRHRVPLPRCRTPLRARCLPHQDAPNTIRPGHPVSVDIRQFGRLAHSD